MSNYKSISDVTEAIKQEVGELSVNEKQLILVIRHVTRFGDLSIETRDGQPTYLVKTTERTKLG